MAGNPPSDADLDALYALAEDAVKTVFTARYPATPYDPTNTIQGSPDDTCYGLDKDSYPLALNDIATFLANHGYPLELGDDDMNATIGRDLAGLVLYLFKALKALVTAAPKTPAAGNV